MFGSTMRRNAMVLAVEGLSRQTKLGQLRENFPHQKHSAECVSGCVRLCGRLTAES